MTNIPIARLYCFKCQRDTNIYVGMTAEPWLGGCLCPECGKRSTDWKDARIGIQYDGCVFTVDNMRVR